MARPKTKDYTEQPYLKKIQALVQSGSIPTRSLGSVQAVHDDWCDIHAGGLCNCDPDIRYFGRPLDSHKKD